MQSGINIKHSFLTICLGLMTLVFSSLSFAAGEAADVFGQLADVHGRHI